MHRIPIHYHSGAKVFLKGVFSKPSGGQIVAPIIYVKVQVFWEGHKILSLLSERGRSIRILWPYIDQKWCDTIVNSDFSQMKGGWQNSLREILVGFKKSLGIFGRDLDNERFIFLEQLMIKKLVGIKVDE